MKVEKLVIVNAQSVPNDVLKESMRLGLPILYDRELAIEGKTYVLEKGASGKNSAVKIRVEKGEDLDKVVEASKREIPYIIVETTDWTIIPLENLVASIKGSKILAVAKDLKDAPALLNVLERGVDGVIITPQSIEELNEFLKKVGKLELLSLKEAEIISIDEVGVGDRVCVDTISMLGRGEGMLVGSKSSFLFLVHSETFSSDFTRPRPFRVNAGSVHSYVMAPEGKVLYLSEVEAGTQLLAVNYRGRCRRIAVGRVKIERRPMIMIKAKVKDIEGSIILQKAETIALTSSNGRPLPVSQIKVGDKVLAHLTAVKGRHFGMAVDEFIVEK